MEKARRTRSAGGVTCLAAVTSTLAACGGGGPGVRGPEAQNLFADYSGTWVLDTIASDAPPAPPGAQSGRGPGASGGDPFGGSTPRGGRSGGARPGGGGMPPGGMGGRGGGGRGGRGGFGAVDEESMEAARHLMTAALQRPTRITLELSDSLFTLAQSPGGRAVVPMGGDEVELSRTAWPTKAKVEWDDLQPRLQRSFDKGGKIVDRFEVVDRNRLILTRTFEAPREGDVELHFAYDREEG